MSLSGARLAAVHSGKKFTRKSDTSIRYLTRFHKKGVFRTSVMDEKREQEFFEPYAVPLKDFHVYVSQTMKTLVFGKNFDGFEKEFNDLKQFALLERRNEYVNSKVAKKNRYLNILPGSSKRVILETCDGDSCSDYINANVHEGSLNGVKFNYISTQAPISNTFDDFWRMVYEKNANIIVMLTKFVESEKSKADQYWSSTIGEKKQLGKMSVTLTNVEEKSEFVIVRTFAISRSGHEDEIREIRHIQYTGWPDFGVPKELGDYALFFETYRLYRSSGGTSPIIAHCSAGVGRTGTFISLDMLLDHVSHESQDGSAAGQIQLNVPKLVYLMRMERPGMIQTKVYLPITIPSH